MRCGHVTAARTRNTSRQLKVLDDDNIFLPLQVFVSAEKWRVLLCVRVRMFYTFGVMGWGVRSEG